MTGLYANFDGNSGNDWESISPSTMWWVAGTPQSAFSNPTYFLDDKNRMTKTNPRPWTKAALTTSSLAQLPQQHAFKADGTTLLATAFTEEDEKAAFKQVDPLTAKMRKRLFAKMMVDGVVERTVGEKKPTSGLAAAELDNCIALFY